MAHKVRIEHKAKVSPEGREYLRKRWGVKPKAPRIPRLNLAAPKIIRVPILPNRVCDKGTFPRRLFEESGIMLKSGNIEAARLGLWFLQEYRMAHKYYGCL